jgi:hypothetical protein
VKRAVAVLLLVAGGTLGVLAPPLSGGTLLAVALIVVGGEWLIRLTLPGVGSCSIDEACDLLAAEQHS